MSERGSEGVSVTLSEQRRVVCGGMKHLVLVLVLVGWQRQCVAEWRSERVSEWRSELERTLPHEVARTLSRWSTSLTRSLTHATAVARESFVVEQVQRGLWPPEAYDAYQTMAASSGNVDSARLMIEYGFTRAVAEVLRQHERGQETIFVAALKCNISLARYLLSESEGESEGESESEGAGVHVVSAMDSLEDGTTPLMMSAFSNCVPVMSLILDALSQAIVLESDYISYIDTTGSHGLSALSVAVLRSSVQSGDLLLNAGADPSQEHVFARTSPLHMAAELGHIDIIKLLCTGGANASATTSVGGTALHTAAQVNMARSVKPLVVSCSLNPDELMQSDTTALYLAAQQGHDATVRALLSVGADLYYAMPVIVSGKSTGSKALAKVKIASAEDEFLNDIAFINSEAANGATALHAAVENGHASVVESLLNHANMDMSTSSPSVSDFVNGQSIGVTPLHLASQYNRLQVAQILMQYGADIDRPAVIDGTTPLYHAISMRHKDMALQLLDFGANACPPCHQTDEVSVRRTSPFILALIQGRFFVPVIREMLRRQPYSSIHIDCTGMSALHISASLKENTALTIFIEQGANLLASNDDLDTVLHIAVLHNRLQSARVILENLRNNLGTNEFFDFILKKQNKDGFTALNLASAGGCTRGAILRLLLAAAGPAVSLPTVSSVAGPLHMAAAEGCVKNVDSLLKAGFRASELYNDQTVLITAIKYNHYNTVLRLLEEGDVTLKSVNIQSKVTDNPLLFAVLRSAAQIVLALLDAGADCNIFVVMSSDPTAEPNSLLEIAQRRRDFDTMKVLSTHPSCSDIRLVY